MLNALHLSDDEDRLNQEKNEKVNLSAVSIVWTLKKGLDDNIKKEQGKTNHSNHYKGWLRKARQKNKKKKQKKQKKTRKEKREEKQLYG